MRRLRPATRRSERRSVAAHLLGAAALCVLAACWHPKREAVARVAHLAYPDCGHGPLDLALPSETVVARELWSGPLLRSEPQVETYAITRRECLTVGTARIEKPFQMVDLEVVWDARGKPLRVWRRITAPGSTERDGGADITLYELRTHDVTITHRGPDGLRDYSRVRGAAPAAVITESHGLLIPWLRRARLAVGQRTHARALDTTLPATVEDAALLVRKPDLDRADAGGRVRVYAVYGRDTVFADADDAVVGDLAGMRPAPEHGDRPFPAQPLYGGADPVGTP